MVYGLKLRLRVNEMEIETRNVTLWESGIEYVLLSATDKDNNELTIEMTHEQAEFLAEQLRKTNQRWLEKQS